MSPPESRNARVIACVVRAACFWPLVILAVASSGAYTTVEALDIFPALPHGTLFREGLKIMGQATPVLLCWNIVLWLPTALASDLGLVIIGLIDLIFSASTLLAVVYQSTFLPHTYSGCQDAVNWHNASSNTSINFFQIASDLNNTDLGFTPQDVCSSYMVNWAMGVAMFILYVVCATCNIVFGSLHWYRSNLKRVYRLAFRLSSGPVYNFRYFLKYRRRDRAAKTIELDVLHGPFLKSTPKVSLPLVLGTESRNQQAGILSNYDVLMLVIRNLHYVDLVNLSLASKSLRELLFPISDLAFRSAAIQSYTCAEGTRSQCWICDMQICSSCSIARSILDNLYSRHLTNCQAYCSDCYRAVVCRNGEFRHSQQCNLRREFRKSYYRIGWQPTERMLCRICAENPLEDLHSLRETRDRVAIARLSQRPLACANCNVSLPVRGPRWWVCSKCKSECRDRIHPAWAQQTEV